MSDPNSSPYPSTPLSTVPLAGAVSAASTVLIVQSGIKQVTLSALATALGTSSGSSTNPIWAYRTVTSGNVIMTTTDAIVEIAKTVPSTTTVTTATPASVGQIFTVKDGGFNSVTYPITIFPASGNFDGSSSVTINVNGGSVDFFWNGANWRLK